MSPSAHLVLVHGAGCFPGMWEIGASRLLTGSHEAVDLQAGVDLSQATMEDYAAVVAHAIADAPPARRTTVLGWSMGGLAAMIAAQDHPSVRLICIDPSAPANDRIAANDATALPRGVYDPFVGFYRPPGLPTRDEALPAKRQRASGVHIARLPAATTIVGSGNATPERGAALAARFGVAYLQIPQYNHYEMVLDPAAVALLAERLNLP